MRIKSELIPLKGKICKQYWICLSKYILVTLTSTTYYQPVLIKVVLNGYYTFFYSKSYQVIISSVSVSSEVLSIFYIISSTLIFVCVWPSCDHLLICWPPYYLGEGEVKWKKKVLCFFLHWNCYFVRLIVLNVKTWEMWFPRMAKSLHKLSRTQFLFGTKIKRF